MLVGRQALKLLSTKTRLLSLLNCNFPGETRVSLWKFTDLFSGTVELELCKRTLGRKLFSFHLFKTYYLAVVVFVAVSRLSLGAQWEWLPSCGVLVSFCSSFSCCREQVLGQQASVISACGVYSTGLVPVAHRLSYSMARRIQPYLGSNLCPLHWKADS